MCKILHITFTRGSPMHKQSVKDDHVLLWKQRFSGTCQAETPQPIIMELCMITSFGKVS
jgi:hypothetical protein